LAWTIEYAETAKKQLGKLDKFAARRIVDFMDERITPSDDARELGKLSRDLLAIYGATAWATTASFATFVMGC